MYHNFFVMMWIKENNKKMKFNNYRRNVIRILIYIFFLRNLYSSLVILNIFRIYIFKKLKRKWHKSQRAVVGAQRSNNTSFFFQY